MKRNRSGDENGEDLSCGRVMLPPHLDDPAWRIELLAAARGAGIETPILFATSGSSGEPKIVVHDVAGVVASARAVNRHLGVGATDVWLRALPSFHVGGFAVRVRAVEGGCGFAEFAGRWDPERFVRQGSEVGATLTSLVPTQVHDLVRSGLEAPTQLRAVVVGGGRLEPGLAQAARALGWPVLASYGSTEAGSQVATQPLTAAPTGPDSHSELPMEVLPGWSVRLAEAEAEEGDGEGDVVTKAESDPPFGGRLELHGPALFRAYLVRDQGDGCWRLDDPKRGGWFRTSDVAILGDPVDGHQSIREILRADRCVKILGEIVGLEAVESALASAAEAQGIRVESVVRAVADPRAGMRLQAVFEIAFHRGSIGGTTDPAGEAVPEECRHVESLKAAVAAYHAGVPGFQRISEGWIVDELPRSPLGKPLPERLDERLRTGRGRRFW